MEAAIEMEDRATGGLRESANSGEPTNEQGQSAETQESSQVIQTTVNKFFDRTSLPAVPVIRGSTNSWRKILWLAFIVLGFSMAIYQSIDLIEGYRKYRTLSTSSEKINSSIPFPSITFCPYMPVLWEKLKIDNNSVYQYFKDKKTPTILEQIEHDFDLEDPFNELLDKLMELNETQRMEMLPEVDKIILTVYSPKILLRDQLMETYIPYYGKCFTLNPGLPGYEKLHVKNTDFIEALIYDDEKNKPPPMQNKGILINLHTPGTSPELQSGSLLHVKGNQDIYITITRHEVNRLPSPYRSACVDDQDIERRKQNPFYTPERPYVYTRRGCKDKFLQDVKLLSGCLVPYFPLRNDSSVKTFCTEDEMLDEIPKFIGCPLTCHQMSYRWTPIVTYSPTKEGYVNDLCEYFAHETMKEYLEESGITKEEFKNGVSRIIFKIQSGLYISLSEEPKYSFSDILGAIGGNIGLWIGISIVSFFEVCELIFVIILKLIKLITRKCWGSIKKIRRRT